MHGSGLLLATLRVHFLCNLPSQVLKAGLDKLAAAKNSLFVIQTPDQVRFHWQRPTEMLRKQFSTAQPIKEAARVDVLACLHF